MMAWLLGLFRRVSYPRVVRDSSLAMASARLLFAAVVAMVASAVSIPVATIVYMVTGAAWVLSTGHYLLGVAVLLMVAALVTLGIALGRLVRQRRGAMKRMVLMLFAVALVAAAPVVASAQPLPPVNTFEGDALRLSLEVFGLMNHNLYGHRLVFSYEVGDDGSIRLRVRGDVPGLKDVDHAAFRYVLRIIGGGSAHITEAAVKEFRHRLLFAMAVSEDRRAHGEKKTAERFGITPEQVMDVIRAYFGMMGDGTPLLPIPPRVRITI